MGIFSKLKRKKTVVINPNASPELREIYDNLVKGITIYLTGKFIQTFYIDIPDKVKIVNNDGYNIDDDFELEIINDVHALIEKSTNNYSKDFGKYTLPSVLEVLINKFNINMSDIAIREKFNSMVISAQDEIMGIEQEVRQKIVKENKTNGIE